MIKWREWGKIKSSLNGIFLKLIHQAAYNAYILDEEIRPRVNANGKIIRSLLKLKKELIAYMIGNIRTPPDPLKPLRSAGAAQAHMSKQGWLMLEFIFQTRVKDITTLALFAMRKSRDGESPTPGSRNLALRKTARQKHYSAAWHARSIFATQWKKIFLMTSTPKWNIGDDLYFTIIYPLLAVKFLCLVWKSYFYQFKKNIFIFNKLKNSIKKIFLLVQLFILNFI